MVKNKRCILILLAGGSGKRMGGPVAKQFLELKGRPLIWYSLNAAEKSQIIDETVMVIRPEDEAYIKTEILNKYSFSKVSGFAYAGRERYESVWNGIRSLYRDGDPSGDDFIFIHDGARPFLTEEIIKNCYEGVMAYGACVAAVPSKDTVKIVSEDGTITCTPQRDKLRIIQTPQTFRADIIYRAYENLMEKGISTATDDAGAVEMLGGINVRTVQGDYRNFKVTTPEDMILAEDIAGEFV